MQNRSRIERIASRRFAALRCVRSRGVHSLVVEAVLRETIERSHVPLATLEVATLPQIGTMRFAFQISKHRRWRSGLGQRTRLRIRTRRSPKVCRSSAFARHRTVPATQRYVSGSLA
jgi:hypothetical protein